MVSGFCFEKRFSVEVFFKKCLLAIHANNGQVFISNPKHSKIALNTEQQIHCCSHELYLKKAGAHSNCVELI